MFEIGDKVICIKGATAIDGEKLIEGKEYTVLGISECRCEQFIYVGIKTSRPTTCHKCDTNISSKDWWHFSHRFIKPEHEESIMKQIKKALKLKTITT